MAPEQGLFDLHMPLKMTRYNSEYLFYLNLIFAILYCALVFENTSTYRFKVVSAVRGVLEIAIHHKIFKWMHFGITHMS